MARLSDAIEVFIKNLIEQKKGTIQIQRNELANYFNCAPSQINYVISTRFSNNNGYYVESRRGGGGSITITRSVANSKQIFLMHIINSMGERISQQTAVVFINNFLDYGLINSMEAKMLRAASSDRSLIDIGVPERDIVRSRIMKNIILSML